jgi:hypothetical protein
VGPAYPNQYAGGNVDRDGDGNADAKRHTDADAHSYADDYAHGDLHAHGDAHRHAYGDRDRAAAYSDRSSTHGNRAAAYSDRPTAHGDRPTTYGDDGVVTHADARVALDRKSITVRSGALCESHPPVEAAFRSGRRDELRRPRA